MFAIIYAVSGLLIVVGVLGYVAAVRKQTPNTNHGAGQNS